MNDYDLINLFHTTLQLLNQIVMDYISVFFAFLIAGYLIADKLKPSMIILVVLLFTAIVSRQVLVMYYLQIDMGVLSNQMALQVTNNNFGLPDLVMAHNRGILTNIFLFISVIGSYIGALIFFFHQRRVGLNKP